jgi:hypothetical protein
MEFKDWQLLGLMAVEFRQMYTKYPAADNILRYMNCIPCYNISTIVIGQIPYPSDIVYTLGSAFLQKDGTESTATTKIFSSHFSNFESAETFIRSTWALLPKGSAFINADYFPSNMGGGSSDVECILRISQTVEFLFYTVVSRPKLCTRLVLICSGSLVIYCGSQLARRLRYLGVSIKQTNFRQPAYLSRIEFNVHLIGKDERYMFCNRRALDSFKAMISDRSRIDSPKESDIIAL